jgi:hypothetical protein
MQEIEKIFDEHIVRDIDTAIQHGITLAHERCFEQLEEDLIAMRAEFHNEYGHFLK